MPRIPITPKVEKIAQTYDEHRPKAMTPETGSRPAVQPGIGDRDERPDPGSTMAQGWPENEFGAMQTHPMEGVMSYIKDMRSNLQIQVHFAQAQLDALQNLEESGEDFYFAEKLPDSSNPKWWEKKVRESSRLKNDVLAFLPLKPTSVPEEPDTETPHAGNISEYKEKQ